MKNRTFNIARAKTMQHRPGQDHAKHAKTADTTEIAARYFVYKLYEATGGYPMQWAALDGIDDS